MTTKPLTIVHEPDAGRFVAQVDGGMAYIAYREVEGRILDLNHTYVPPAARGGGIASQLTAHALQHARNAGFRVIPSCPFVASYIRRDPQYRSLVV